MAKFITLTDAIERGNVWRLPAGQFVYRNRKYDESPHIGAAVFFFDKLLFVTETPEQIDALLGVTEDLSEKAAKTLESEADRLWTEAKLTINFQSATFLERRSEAFRDAAKIVRAARGE